MNLTEVLDSFTGHEDDAIEARFGRALEGMDGYDQRRAALFRSASSTRP